MKVIVRLLNGNWLGYEGETSHRAQAKVFDLSEHPDGMNVPQGATIHSYYASN